MIRPRVSLPENPGWEHDYIEFAKGMRTEMRFYERRLFKELPAEGRFLEIGPGPGYLLAEVAQKHPGLNVHGLDISPIMLEHAHEVMKMRGVLERVQLDLGSAYDMPYQNDYFDFIFNMNTLHSIEEPERFFQEIIRVLKPRGTALVFAWKRDVFWPFREAGRLHTWYLHRTGSRLEGMYPLINASYTKAEVEDILKGLRATSCSVRTKLFSLNISVTK